MKYDFWRHYPGPRGPHLSCLTKFTVSKERQETGTMKPGKRHKQVIRKSQDEDA